MANTNESLNMILSKLDGVKQTGQNQYQARCPCRDDPAKGRIENEKDFQIDNE